MPCTTHTTGFVAEDDELPIGLPLSDDELVIAYSMVAALYQLVLRWSQNGVFDNRAQSIAESAEQLLLRTDVMRRILRIAGLERRQEFMTDRIELLEEQKRQLLKALRPFAKVTVAAPAEPNQELHLDDRLTPADFTRARVIYNMLMDAKALSPAKQTDTIIN